MSQQLGTILVAVDFGEASARALTLAGALAAATGARLRVLHAESIDAPPYFTQAQLDVLEGELQENRARATAFLRDFVRKHTAVPFEPVIESRTPSEAVLHASSGVDLVVMGTHGRRGPSHWWLGSVAERVLRETAVPLMVVHENVQVVAPSAFTKAMLLADGTAEHPADHGADGRHRPRLWRSGDSGPGRRGAAGEGGARRHMGGGARAHAAHQPLAVSGGRAARAGLQHARDVRSGNRRRV